MNTQGTKSVVLANMTLALGAALTAMVMMTIMTALAMSSAAFAGASYVFHRQTGDDPRAGSGDHNCPVPMAYADVLTPTASQAVTVRFKIDYSGETDNARLYYTTNGSAPSGSFGAASGSTLVIAASYDCRFRSGSVDPYVDVAKAVIPAQAAGTTVKYIVSAWNSGGGDEIFANSGTCVDCGNITSSADATIFSYITLTVDTVTTASGPANQSACLGGSVTFTTIAGGTGPHSYVWRKDGALIADANGASLTVTNANAGSVANYCVEVTGALGSATNCASLALLTNTVAVGPVNINVCKGGSVMFSTVGDGTGPHSYVWRKGVAVMTGENSPSITINNASASDAATYCVEVTGACNSVTNCATLGVSDLITPTLSITRPAGEAVCWPQTCRIYLLEESSDLLNWSPSSATVTPAGGKNCVTLPDSDGTKFFRLHLQN